MDWNDWLSILRWRAIEEADTDGSVLPEDRRREATARTRAGLASDSLAKTGLGNREAGFLLRRARWLEHEVLGCNGTLVRVMERLGVVCGRPAWIWLGWLVAGGAGHVLTGLGQESELNLLALPLVGLLAWNAVIMLLALLMEMQRESRSAWVEWLALRFGTVVTDRGPGDAEPLTGVTVDHRFAQLTQAAALERWQRRFRAWLHIAAALVAMGGISGLYTRGWAKEYRAVWESTLVSEPTARSFFSTLFHPATTVLRLPLPLDLLPSMHRTAGKAETPAPALPWLHLYAGTLLLLVILPRGLLAGLTVWRAHQVTQRRMHALGWQSYLMRTLRAVEGGGETVPVLIHATEPTQTHREVWARGVRGRFGQMAQPEFISIHLGDEDEFTAAWHPQHPHVVIVFNLATTPEVEVQRKLVMDISRVLHARMPGFQLLILLDATSVGGRWSPEKTAGREKLWTQMMEGSGAEILVAARRTT